MTGIGTEAILTVLAVIGTGGVALVRALFTRIERSLDARFLALDQARRDSQQNWHDTYAEHIRREEREFEALRSLDRSFMEFRAQLPTIYLRRDELRDYLTRLDMRFETINDKLNHLLAQPEEAEASPLPGYPLRNHPRPPEAPDDAPRF
jgi:hypothetical protein